MLENVQSPAETEMRLVSAIIRHRGMQRPIGNSTAVATVQPEESSQVTFIYIAPLNNTNCNKALFWAALRRFYAHIVEFKTLYNQMSKHLL